MVVVATPNPFTSPLSYIARASKVYGGFSDCKNTKEDIAARGKMKTCYDNQHYPKTLSQFLAKTRSKNEKMHRSCEETSQEKGDKREWKRTYHMKITDHYIWRITNYKSEKLLKVQ